MTLRAISNRDNNVEAQFDATSRGLRFTTKKQVARLQRRTKPLLYGCVRWFWDGSGDGSEAEIVTSTGARIGSPTLVWIDLATSIVPRELGNAYYQLVISGRGVTRGGVTRDLYRAVAWMGRASAPSTVSAAAQAAYTATGYAKVQSSGGADITTTINAVAGINQFKVKTPYDPGAVGAKFDMPTPFDLVWSASAGAFAIVPEWTRRSRFGNWNTGGAISIDWGETFIAHFTASIYENATSEAIDMHGTFICYYDAGSRNLRVEYVNLAQKAVLFNAITSVNFGASSTTSAPFLDFITFRGNASDPTIATGFPVAATTSPVAIGTFKDVLNNVVGTLNFVFTEDATTKRITAWSLSITGLTAGWAGRTFNLMVYGGREYNWPLVG